MGPHRSIRRRDRKPIPRNMRPRGPGARETLNFGSEPDRELSTLTDQLGCWGESSHELDSVDKIDRLFTGIRGVSCHCLPVPCQMSREKHPALVRPKIQEFIRCASAKFPGQPLLYIDMSGRVTWEMAKAVRKSLIELSINPFKNGRFAHGLAVNAQGRSRWFRIQDRQIPKVRKEEKEDR